MRTISCKYFIIMLLTTCVMSALPIMGTAVLAITGDDIVDGTITDDDLADGAVTSQKLSNGAVTTKKLKDKAVTSNKLAPELLGRITALERATLEIVDANEKKIGNVISIFGQVPIVPFQARGQLITLVISQDHQQFPEACKSQHSSGIPTCAFVNRHVKMGFL